jgi:predicted PurR-regulated permease PerM
MRVSRPAQFQWTIDPVPSMPLVLLRPILLPIVAGVFLACLLATAIDSPEHIAINGSLAALSAMQLIVIGFISVAPKMLPIAGKLNSFIEPFPRIRSVISARRPWLHAVKPGTRRDDDRARRGAHP